MIVVRNNWDWEDIKGTPLGWTGPERILSPIKFSRLWLRQGLIAAALFLLFTFIFRFDGFTAQRLQLGLRHYFTEPTADYTTALVKTVGSAMWLDTYDRWVFHDFNPEMAVVPAGLEQVKPLMTLPLSGTISRPYGLLVIDGQQYFHQGIDIRAPGGTAVQAILAGRVIRDGNDPILGKVIEIDHGRNLVSVYGILGSVKVHRDQVVERGETIATLAAGKVAQLHFEIRQNGKAIDPEIFLTSPGKI